LKYLSLVSLLLFVLLTAALGASGDWLAEVPQRDHVRTSPARDDKDAVAAGQILFEDHCSKCHGKNALGSRSKPSLRTGRIQQVATEGDLHWLLVNGELRRGMPSWSRLPDQQLWQVIAYLKSLGVNP